MVTALPETINPPAVEMSPLESMLALPLANAPSPLTCDAGIVPLTVTVDGSVPEVISAADTVTVVGNAPDNDPAGKFVSPAPLAVRVPWKVAFPFL